MEKFWDQNAKTWSQVIDQKLIASRFVTDQAIVEAILSLKPKAVLDLGCGEGWLTAEVAKHAIVCDGIDGSNELIQIAAQKYPKLSFQKVTYQDIESGWKPNKTYDVLVFNFALMDEHLEKLFSNLQNFAGPNSHLLIQTLHPLALPQGKEGWQSEDFKAMTLPFAGNMPWYGRNFESWKKLFAKTNWHFEKLEEPGKDDKPLSALFYLKK